MGKTVNFSQTNLIPLMRALKENVELDTYKIGGETDAPVGGRYYHVSDEETNEKETLVTESKNSSRAHKQTRQIIAQHMGADENDPRVIQAEQNFEQAMFGEGKRTDWMIVLEPVAYNWYLETRNIEIVKKYLNYIYLKGTEAAPPSAYITNIKKFNNFNDVKQFIGQQMKADDAASIEAQNNMEENLNQNYEVRGPLSFEEAWEIGNYSCPNGQICYTQNKNTWDGDEYGDYGKKKCYVLLRNGWESVPAQHDGSETNNGLPAPLNQFNGYDSYGLSMIFVWVGRFGNLSVSNTRWNHNADYAPGRGVDLALTELDIARLMGAPFEKVFGVKKVDVVEYVRNGLSNPNIMLDDIFDTAYDSSEGIAAVKIGSKYNYVVSKYDSSGWNLNKRYLLWDKPYDEWFDCANDFNGEIGMAVVRLDKKSFFIDKYGELHDITKLVKNMLSVGTRPEYIFDEIDGLGGSETLCRVTFDYIKFNFINQKTNQLIWDKPYDEWFDYCRSFKEDAKYNLVKLGTTFYYLDIDGNIHDFLETIQERIKHENITVIFDYVGHNINSGYSIVPVKLAGRYNYVNTKTRELVWKKTIKDWFSGVWDFSRTNHTGEVSYKGKTCILNADGKLYDTSGNLISEGRYGHSISNYDMSEVGEVQCEDWTYDEEEYQEWLVDNELQDTLENKIAYIEDFNVEFDISFFDNQTYHLMGGDWAYYDDLVEVFGERMAKQIETEMLQYGKSKFDTSDLYSDTAYDINNSQELNDIAMRLLPHGEYYQNCRGFILTNGVIVYTEGEHNDVLRIPGINSKFQFIELGNIRILDHSVDIGAKPTWEQEKVLRQVITSYDGEEFYLDIFSNGSEIGAKYPNANYQYIMGEINRFYSEGIRPQGGYAYENKKKEKIINENYETEVESSEVDLSSFKKKDKLAPSIWKDDDVLDSKVRLKLLDIADDFWDSVNVTWVEPKGIILTGSICNFNWSEFSDIDLHLIVDFKEIDDRTDFVRDYMDAKKNEWNNEHKDLKIMGYPVELYVQNVDEMPESGGIYDLEENSWIRKPKYNDIKSIGLDKFSIKDRAAMIMTIIDDMWHALSTTDDMYDVRQLDKDASDLWKKVKAMRKSSLAKNGESGPGNIVYKVMRRMGYLDKLFDLRSAIYDKLNSINEAVHKFKVLALENLKESKVNEEVLNEYLEKDNNLPLYRYFKWAATATDFEKVEDLIYQCGYETKKYIDKMARQSEEFESLRLELVKDEDIIYDYEFIERVTNAIVDNDLTEAFIYYLQVSGNEYELPSWLYMEFNRVVKNEWCIHFGNDSESIARKGFTKGTEEIECLAFTTAVREKRGPGYDFAFPLGEKDIDHNYYGNEAVIFQTSGVEIYHNGDSQNQVVFWGPNAKNFIPIKYDEHVGEWCIYGMNNQVLKSGRPSEILEWVLTNLPQYRKQIMAGKNGFTPSYYDYKQGKRVPYPIYRNESATSFKKDIIDEEVVADGNAEHNPFEKRWKAERQALKDFLVNCGKIMTSKENGKQYKVFYDQTISNLIGYNYCLCIQWDPIELKPESTIYVRALDKFTNRIFQAQFDDRGKDNLRGTTDDISYGNA